MNKCNITTKIKKELERNGNKLSYTFIKDIADAAICQYFYAGTTTVCVLTLCSGHQVVAYSQVLDDVNSIKEIGEQIARENATNRLWEVCGAIAKTLV